MNSIEILKGTENLAGFNSAGAFHAEAFQNTERLSAEFSTDTKTAGDNDVLSIGLFGFGCVGQGLYDVLRHSEGLRANIVKICVKDRAKERTLPSGYFTFDRNEVLKRDEHDLIVELIDDSDAALEIITRALVDGKDVVTANKKAVAENLELLYKLQLETGSSLLYEAACAGSVPIIRTLEEYYDNELLDSINAILNGSSNYILTKMEEEKLTLGEAITAAQQCGFAESDPWLDIGGFDSKYKLCLLGAHAFGLILKPEDILNNGIQNVSEHDINYAKEKCKRVKLLAHAKKCGDKFRFYVLPHFVDRQSPLGAISNEYNAIEVEGVYSDKQLFTGKGAGSHPTGSAVLSDISAITYNYRYGYKKLKKRVNGHIPDYSKDGRFVDRDFTLRVYIGYKNKEALHSLKIENVEEQYSSKEHSYIIANVKFTSLAAAGNVPGLFICVCR